MADPHDYDIYAPWMNALPLWEYDQHYEYPFSREVWPPLSFGEHVPSDWNLIKVGGETWRVEGWKDGSSSWDVRSSIGGGDPYVRNALGIATMDIRECHELVVSHPDFGVETIPGEDLERLLSSGQMWLVPPAKRMDWASEDIDYQSSRLMAIAKRFDEEFRTLVEMVAYTPRISGMDLDSQCWLMNFVFVMQKNYQHLYSDCRSL
jgi:hypothetical protein